MKAHLVQVGVCHFRVLTPIFDPHTRPLLNLCRDLIIYSHIGPLFIRPFEKRDILWKQLRFHPVFIKLGEYVGGNNILFYNLPNTPRHS